MQSSISTCFEELSAEICDKVYGFCSTNEEQLSIAQDKYRKEVTERKRLHNVVQELKGNIRVFARSRPLSSKDRAAGKAAAVTFTSETDLMLNNAGQWSIFIQCDDATFNAQNCQDPQSGVSIHPSIHAAQLPEFPRGVEHGAQFTVARTTRRRGILIFPKPTCWQASSRTSSTT